eukprot:SAG11_NODE_3_length_39220_cov_67.005828_22_plen_266_part_00
MWQGRGMRVGEHPLVSSYIQSLTNDDYLHHDRRKYKYEDTWDVQPVFDYVHSVVDSDAFSVRVQPLNSTMRSTLRSVVVPLARIILCCRSSDLTCIYRGQSSDVQCIRFTHDDDGALESVQLRYCRPKQRNGLPVSAKGYTPWTTIDVIDDPSVCLATLLHEYYIATDALPRHDDALFITDVSKRFPDTGDVQFWGLSSDRLAHVMQDAMTAAGIPAEFCSHSARHAGLAHMKQLGHSDDEVMARANMSARTYVTYYRRKVRRVG